LVLFCFFPSPHYRNHPHVSRDAGRQTFPDLLTDFRPHFTRSLQGFLFFSLPDRFPRPFSPNLNFAGFDSSQKKKGKEKTKTNPKEIVENGQLSSGILCCNEHHLLGDWYSAHICRGGVAEGVDG